MNRFKATALIVSMVVLNPLCCCLQLFGSPAEPLAAEAAPHDCCKSPTDNRAEDQKQTSDHTSEPCPHSFEKESLIAQSADSLDLQAKLLCQVFALSGRSLLDPGAKRQQVETLLRPFTQPLPPATPVSQAYCVLIL